MEWPNTGIKADNAFDGKSTYPSGSIYEQDIAFSGSESETHCYVLAWFYSTPQTSLRIRQSFDKIIPVHVHRDKPDLSFHKE